MTTVTSTTTVIAALQSAGLALTLTPERGLGVTPASKLTNDLRGLIKVHRDELVRWLGRCASNDPASSELLKPPPAPAVVTSPVSSEVSTVETVGQVNKLAVNSPVNKVAPDWKALDMAYQAHHVNCPTCIAAGKGYGLRCGVGASLWAAYDAMDMPVHGKASVRVAPVTPPSHSWDAPTVDQLPLTDAENTRNAARLALFDARGLTVDDAERLASKLLTRDREGDHRGVCAECRQLVGNGPGRWKCADQSPTHINELAGASLGAAFVHLSLHRCTSIKGAAS